MKRAALAVAAGALIGWVLAVVGVYVQLAYGPDVAELELPYTITRHH